MVKQNFNRGWRFSRFDDQENPRNVDLPFDAMQTEVRRPRLKGGSNSGYFPGGKYLYRKSLFGEAEYEGRTIMLEFEGVYQKSTVCLNGAVVGGHVYGYTGFWVDLTGKIKIGQGNEISVTVDNSQTPNSRWYSGSGIYRPVWLLLGDRRHIVPDGVKVVTRSIEPAEIQVDVETVEAEGLDIRVEVLLDGEAIARGEGRSSRIRVPEAQLWDADNPYLYDLRVFLVDGERVVDEVALRTGIRSLKWRANEGLLVNGKPIKLRGGCFHHDSGPLGAATFRKAEYRRAKILKEAGFNAVRCAHNPVSRALLEACDELGLYVMDEAFDSWLKNKTAYDYAHYFRDEWEADLAAMVRKDYCHPSVVMYSIGNEIAETALPEGVEFSGRMTRLCRSLDDSRPVTNGINPMLNIMAAKGRSVFKNTAASKDDAVDPYGEEADSAVGGSALFNMLMSLAPKLMKLMTSPKASYRATEASYSELDIAGYNYGLHLYAKHLEWAPRRIIVGSETFPQDIARTWGSIEETPSIIGDFMWTAWDYLGEAGIGLPSYGSARAAFAKPYPVIGAGCGAIDITGFLDTPAYVAAIAWKLRREPYISVRPLDHSGEKCAFGMWRGTDAIASWSWTGMEGRKAEIEVYSPGTSVELFQDGTSLGRKSLVNYKVSFKTVYRSGELIAVSYDAGGREMARSSLRSASKETRIAVYAEESTILADGEDLAYIHVDLTDEAGIVKALADRSVRIRVEGPGRLIAVGSGNPSTNEAFTGDSYTTYNGRMIAILRSDGGEGRIAIRVESEGLDSQEAMIEARGLEGESACH
jgi:Beta-galactosidase/beta-glucuronidase